MSNHTFILPKTEKGAIQRSYDIGRVVAELEGLEEEKSWRVIIEQCKFERSLKQNKYLFGVAYKLLSKELGYEKMDLHKTLLGLHFGTRIKRVPPTPLNPRGLDEVPLRTTTTDEKGRRAVLGRTKFAEYVEFVQRWGAEAGVVIPDPDPTLAQDYLEEKAA